MHRLFFIAAAALAPTMGIAGGVSPTQPQAVVVAPPPAPQSDWSGFYIGLSTGNFEFDEDGFSDDTSSLSGFAGYLHDFGNVVAGGEVYFSRMDDYENAFIGSEDSEFGLRGRVGYDLGRVLPYAVVGVTRFESTAYTERDTYFGYGLGADVQVLDNLRVGLQVYQGANDEFVPLDGPFDIETRRVSVRAAFNF